MSKKFIPTEAQRKKALEELSNGIASDYVRYGIINPETQKPIDQDTFCKVFAEEIKEARYHKSIPIIRNYYDLIKNSTDPKEIKGWINLNCRGMFGYRFQLDLSKTTKDQIDQVIKAGAEGYIGSQEVQQFVDAITKRMTTVEFEEIKREFIEMKKENESLRSQLEHKK